MNLEDLIVEVRDRFLNRVGTIAAKDLELDYEGVFNNVGKWTLELPFEHPMTAHLRTPGSGLIVTNPRAEAPWATIWSGPTTAPELAITPTDATGSIKFEGVDDNILLSDRLVLPTGASGNGGDEDGAHYTVDYGFHVEDVMRFLVRDHASEYAKPTSRLNGLFKAPEIAGNNAIPTPAGPVMGDNTNGTLKWRYDNLGVAVASLANTYGIGFRVVQVGGFYEFHTYVPTDKRDTIRLDALNRTLDGQRVKTEAPTITRAYVAGQGDLADRTILTYTTTTAQDAESDWGRRVEVFIDQRQTDEATALQQAADEAFADGGSTTLTIQAIPNENASMEYGVDWHLGERVTAVVDSVEYGVYVTGVILKADSTGGLVCGVKLGTDYVAKGSNPAAVLLKRLDTRVANLEANVPATDAASGAGTGGWTNWLLYGPGGWIPYGYPTYPMPGHRVINGITYLRGMAYDGSGQLATLPTGARPGTDIIVPATAYGLTGSSVTGGIGCRITITAAGVITIPSNVNNTWVSLAGISFPAEQ